MFFNFVKYINCFQEMATLLYRHPIQRLYLSIYLPKKHRLESRLPEEISITSDMQMIPPLWQKVKRN